MAKIDDYREAVKRAVTDLRERKPADIAQASGADFKNDTDGSPVMTLRFLNRDIVIRCSDFGCMYQDSGEDVSIQQQILILHYLKGAKGNNVTEKWIAYQEIPEGMFYLDAFLRRAKTPMVQAFGSRPERLSELAKNLYAAEPFEHGDVSIVVQAFPYVPVVLILWKGDDEFPPEGNLLFDKSIAEIFSAEDIAWLAGMIIYPLIGMLNQG